MKKCTHWIRLTEDLVQCERDKGVWNENDITEQYNNSCTNVENGCLFYTTKLCIMI